MYVMDTLTMGWSCTSPLSAPPKRSSHIAAGINDTFVVIFGGRSASGDALGDVAVFDTTSMHWMIGVKHDGCGGPAPRYGHAAAVLDGKDVVIHGGIGADGQLLADAWILSMEKPGVVQWRRVAFDATPLRPRAGHQLVAASASQIFAIGGRCDINTNSTGGMVLSPEVFRLDFPDASAPIGNSTPKAGSVASDGKHA
jgi:hypothetical protein